MLKARLRLEGLEAREVPAGFWWTGKQGTDATNPGNWLVAVEDDEPYHELPIAGDSVVINTSSKDCYGLVVTGGGAFASLAVSGTGGTTSFGAAIATGDFLLTGGAIAQDSTENLTVNSTFTWTGGTLNSTPSDATVYVNGGGSIAPLNAGTVQLGSQLIMSGTQPAPKTVTQSPGTIQITNAATGVVIGAYCTLSATITASNVAGITRPLGSPPTGLSPHLGISGKLIITGPGAYNTNLEVVNEGEFTLQGSASAFLTSPDLGSYYQEASAAQLRIQNGSVLHVSNGAYIGGGIVFVMMNQQLAASQQTATVQGKFIMAGSSTLFFDIPLTIGTALTYGTFTVNGNVDWRGGKYQPSVDYTTSGLANKWIVNGEMKSAAVCIIEPVPQRGQNPPANSNWEILIADTTAGTAASLIAGSPLTRGTFDVGGKKVWKLNS